MRRITKTEIAIAIFVFSAGYFYTQGIDVRQKSRHNAAYAVLDIRSNRSAADVYINNVYLGTTPFTAENILPGNYSLRIEKKGFYTEYVEYVFESGTSYKIVADLKEITGTLHIRLNEADADLYLNGVKIGPPMRCFYLGKSPTSENPTDGCKRDLTVPEGTHEITVKKFGKQSNIAQVYVFRETQVYLDVHLQDADFELTSFSAEKTRFNPYNPGNLGICRFNFSVTGPGDGVLEIYGSDSQPVYRRHLKPFTTENESCTWDGRNENGNIVKKGTYRAYLQVRGTDNPEFTQSEQILLTVDPDLFVPLHLFSASGLSAGLVPSVRLMPQGSLYSACTAGSDFSLRKGFTSTPVFLGFAYAPLFFLETSCAAGTEIYSESTPPLIIQASVKAAQKTGFFRYGALLGASYSSGRALSAFNEGILYAGILLSAEKGPVYIGAAEQVYFGEAGGRLIPFNGNLKTGLSCSFQKGFFAVHLSAALFSLFNAAGIRGFASVYTGTEFCLLIPKTVWMPAAGFYYRYNADGRQETAFRIGCAIYH